jgi:leucine dehydrogenase
MHTLSQFSRNFNAPVFSKDQKTKLEPLAVPGYELVLKVTNPTVGLTAIIAIHSTALGPALGGTRIAPYSSFEEALEDVKRLSKGMTYKAAVAEVGLGGGKSVIIADPAKDKTPELLHAFGEAVDLLEGLYICAEDMGCTTADAMEIRKATKYVTGLPHANSSGDPGRFTAWGTFKGIQAVAKKIYGSSSLEGLTVAVLGLGNVGCQLLEHLFWEGANIVVADINEEKAEQLALTYGAKKVSPTEIVGYECDIFSPCAVGGIINARTIPLLKCKGIAGCANNQLAKDEHADALQLRDIIYAPDYVINAGGLLNVAAELEPGGYHPKRPRDKTTAFYDNLVGILEIAEKNHMSTQSAANALAEYRIQYNIGKRTNKLVFPSIF